MVSSINNNGSVWTNYQVSQENGTAAADKPAAKTQVAGDSFEVASGAGQVGQKAVALAAPKNGGALVNSAADAGYEVMLDVAADTSAVAASSSAKSGKTTAYDTALAALKNNAKFKAAKADVQEAVLAQCKNFPNENSVKQLERMLGTKWFGKMNLSDQQRAAKSIAYLAEVSQDSKFDQQKDLIDNTLNRILTDKVPLAFDNMDDDPGTITFGYSPAYGSGIFINRALVPDGNSPFPKTNKNAKHAVLATIVHETSHSVNKDVNNATYKYFQAEYRAWYVGYIAENGKVPTRQEAFDRCMSIINLYENINAALYKTDTLDNILDWLNNKVTGDDFEQTKIVNFLNLFIKNSDPASIDTEAEIKAFFKQGVKEPRAAAPAPDQSLKQDMDN